MHTLKILSLLAIAGSALAAPAPRRGHSNNNVEVVYETIVYTAYVTQPFGVPVTTPASEPATTSPATTSPTTTSPVTEAADTTTATQEPAVPVETGSGSTGYMAVVDKWRSKLGLSALTQDSTLEANALKTAQDGNGQMVHELNPGTFAQVLAPGNADNFENVFVGGWLCERPNLPGLDGACDTYSSGWMYTSTGHADILTSPSYSKIGCALAYGIWACDLA